MGSTAFSRFPLDIGRLLHVQRAQRTSINQIVITYNKVIELGDLAVSAIGRVQLSRARYANA